MAFTAEVRARLTRKESMYESRREREFYRYFEPVRNLSKDGPKLCDLHDERAVRDHQPVPSPDRALTAFCQLGALRLQCRRSLLFFFDSNFAYVLAEATQSLSLHDGTTEIDDAIWLGETIIPRGFSICEETICKAIPCEPSDPEYGSSLIHIINDLESDTKFCDRPYVTDGPRARFYAGVPITTDKGITIGAYCCLDDKTREGGLTDKETNFLKDMSRTVMTHLETVRAKAEHQRGAQMVAGLGAFVEGASSLQEWTEEQNSERSPRKRDPSSIQVKPPLTRGFSYTETVEGIRSNRVRTPSRSSGSHEQQAPKYNTAVDGGSLTPNANDENHLSRTPTITRHAEDLRERIVTTGIGGTLERAIHLVQEAMKVDGAVFLDANVCAYDSLVNESVSSSEQTSSSETIVSGTDTNTEGEEQGAPVKSPSKPCRVHAVSHRSHHVQLDGPETRHDSLVPNVTEKFLRSLLRRCPRGKIWNFNEDGHASSDDECSEGTITDDGRYLSPDRSDVFMNSETSRQTRRKKTRVDDSRVIQRLFPGARSVALVGMWDQNRGRWFSACLVWTYAPLRLFSAELEVSYLSAFCDVIMAEIHRIEAQSSDQAKSDFISSISHELRSPLHGILGSVECLQDQAIDANSAAMVNQIEVCGRTLGDIVDNILDYTKISHHTQASAGFNDGPQSRRRTISNSTRRARLGDMMSFDTLVSLDTVTEEVVQATVYSFSCSRSKEVILNRKVAVILDIDPSNDPHTWNCHMPLGAWKRTCINLISNSLKYTDEGSIHVSLKAVPIQGKRKRFNAVFTVKDTGRGMSQQFLENHLFKAFAQEDSLAEGTGLGMSLVAKIVRTLGGSIDVQSEKGVGTTISVTIPIDRPPHRSKDCTIDQALTQQTFSQTKVGMVDYAINQEQRLQQPVSAYTKGQGMVFENMKQACTKQGVQVLETNELVVQSEADVLVLVEADFHEHQRRKSFAPNGQADTASASTKDIPIIVICDNAISERRLRASCGNGMVCGHVEYISQPCGPQRLTAAIKGCLESCAEEKVDSATDKTELPFRSMDQSEKSQVEPGAQQTNGEERQNAFERTVNSDPQNVDFFAVRSRSTGDDPHTPPAVFPLPTSKTEVVKNADGKKVRQKAPVIVEPSGISLLLVDDNHINLQLLVNYANKQGHQKATAADGQQAIDAYKAAWQKHLERTSCGILADKDEQPPGVILMDINMPVLNGFKATRAIRTFEQQYNLTPAHIIALTGLGGAAAQQEAFTAGVDLFLTKPVRLKELTKLLDGIKAGVAEEEGQGQGK